MKIRYGAWLLLAFSLNHHFSIHACDLDWPTVSNRSRKYTVHQDLYSTSREYRNNKMGIINLFTNIFISWLKRLCFGLAEICMLLWVILISSVEMLLSCAAFHLMWNFWHSKVKGQSWEWHHSQLKHLFSSRFGKAKRICFAPWQRVEPFMH